jgi:hypothetical protein
MDSLSACYLWVTGLFEIPYFIEYSVHFYTLKMMQKYSLCAIHGR